ncbi:MAG: neutral/alkaline non-lysosomal ceramidase N-terminal domain-containing protein [Candidatus Handelsmanbacteria bacterium]|nr:neutral/alkaline non-lysosomal ceramidase N-terminal domain-containing protein [Candidatus Handelsmanbacteria bacterium]
MLKIGVAQLDITPPNSVWLTGYGNRDHRSEGVYQALRAGALFLQGAPGAALILSADLIGYSSAFAAGAKLALSEATGLHPGQIVLTATHTHCAPFFTPWMMPGQLEPGYAALVQDRFVELARRACAGAVPGRLAFSRGRSTFGVNRRLPDGQGGVHFAPNPDGTIDRDLDTLWCSDAQGLPLASLTFYGCHPTSRGGYLIGGDYPGYLTRALEEETGAPAFFATGCAGDVRPWFKSETGGFATPDLDQLEAAGRAMAAEVLQSQPTPVAADQLRLAGAFHLLPYADPPTREKLQAMAADPANPLLQQWAGLMLQNLDRGPLPTACPQEIQVLQLNSDLRLVFLGGEILSAIGLHLKEVRRPATTVVAGYSNGLIGYVPSQDTYDLGGYEVDGSHYYFLRPAPFARDAESRILAQTQALVRTLG